jgi:hypothetical protein
MCSVPALHLCLSVFHQCSEAALGPKLHPMHYMLPDVSCLLTALCLLCHEHQRPLLSRVPGAGLHALKFLGEGGQ